MTLQIRRVVTGHDASGHAVVQIDEVPKNLVSSRPGANACVVWTTEGFPVDNTGKEDVVLVWGWSGAGSLEAAGYEIPPEGY